MFKYVTAMLWALAIIFTAMIAREGGIEPRHAAVLFLTLPVFATLSMRSAGLGGYGRCTRRQEERA